MDTLFKPLTSGERKIIVEYIEQEKREKQNKKNHETELRNAQLNYATFLEEEGFKNEQQRKVWERTKRRPDHMAGANPEKEAWLYEERHRPRTRGDGEYYYKHPSISRRDSKERMLRDNDIRHVYLKHVPIYSLNVWADRWLTPHANKEKDDAALKDLFRYNKPRIIVVRHLNRDGEETYLGAILIKTENGSSVHINVYPASDLEGETVDMVNKSVLDFSLETIIGTKQFNMYEDAPLAQEVIKILDGVLGVQTNAEMEAIVSRLRSAHIR